MRTLILLTLLSGCVGYVTVDPNAARDCERVKTTLIFPNSETTDNCK